LSARRPWAWPLVPLYAAGLAIKEGLRRLGIPQTQRLKWPVVSIGSLSAGGAGKTPTVIALAELLRERGWNVNVLSRGYGRAGRGIEPVDPQAQDAASRFGDEPVLIARRTGVPVWVGAQRHAAGLAAEAQSGPQSSPHVHLLDDGFQHRALARTVDIVLVTAEDLNEVLLPAGNRRESFRALRRADVVVLREEEWDRVLPRISDRLRPGAALWKVRRALELPERAQGDPPRRLVAFSAIARPKDFVHSIERLGLHVVDSVASLDHHRYTKEDMHRLIAALRGSGGHAFVTTEKDAVKLDSEMRAQLAAAAPLLVARLSVEFVDADVVVRELEGRIS
jgi:tetraacyldisaccharide 4'-kinase